MLPKTERLTKKDFETMRPRIVFRGNFVDISTVSESSFPRFSCVIAKKRIKKAVERNKVKRKIYSILEKIKPISPYLLIIYPKTTVLHGNYTQIQEEISKAFATL